VDVVESGPPHSFRTAIKPVIAVTTATSVVRIPCEVAQKLFLFASTVLLFAPSVIAGPPDVSVSTLPGWSLWQSFLHAWTRYSRAALQLDAILVLRARSAS
jgi:hypothetical protein